MNSVICFCLMSMEIKAKESCANMIQLLPNLSDFWWKHIISTVLNINKWNADIFHLKTDKTWQISWLQAYALTSIGDKMIRRYNKKLIYSRKQ